MTPQDFDRLLEEGKYSNWTTELLTQLISINTQSGKDSSTAKEGGRPKIENGDILSNEKIFGVMPSGKVRTWEDTYSRSGKVRSKTFPGIARAMAEQWGGLCE